MLCNRLLPFVFILLLIDSVVGYQCHCSQFCSGNSTCDSNNLGCRISIRAPENFINQGCVTSWLESLSCSGKLVPNEGSIVPFSYCCKADLCNSVETFNQLIAEYWSSVSANASPTSSSLSTQTISLNSTVPSPLTTVVTATSTKFIQPSSSSSLAVLASSNQTSSANPTSSSTLSELTTTTSIVVSTASSILITSRTYSTPSSSKSTSIYASSTRISSSTSPSMTLLHSPNISIVPAYVIVIIVILIVVLVISVLVILLIMFFHFYPRHVVGIAVPIESDGTPTISTESCGEFSSNPDLFDGTTSGSGSGLPLLIQQSVATQVTLHELVGKGRFGEVWRASYKGDDVAVKIFHTKEEASWVHEKDIYQTCLIRHPNILRFIAADNKDIGIATQLWLISEYCDLGSLYEVLVSQTLDEAIVLRLCYTAACGLAHLHSEINGTEGKPAIAHRDLKSRNILVKGDYSCTIADLGLALRYYRATDTVEELPTKRVGTRRYLAPEILDDTMNNKSFDGFKRSDIYSFGLVLWEIARRGQCGGHSEEYQLPYFDHVTPDPSFEEMRRVVATERKRPSFPNRWSQSKVFDGLGQIIEQCWHHNGEARLTALRVKKNLQNLQSMHGKIETTSPTATTNNQIQISL